GRLRYHLLWRDQMLAQEIAGDLFVVDHQDTARRLRRGHARERVQQPIAVDWLDVVRVRSQRQDLLLVVDRGDHYNRDGARIVVVLDFGQEAPRIFTTQQDVEHDGLRPQGAAAVDDASRNPPYSMRICCPA